MTTSTGQELKEQGMAQVEANAYEQWKREFSYWGRWTSLSGLPFTSEDITSMFYVGLPPSGSVNAIGAAMNRLVRALNLERVGYVKAKHPKAHARMLAQWKRKG